MNCGVSIDFSMVLARSRTSGKEKTLEGVYFIFCSSFQTLRLGGMAFRSCITVASKKSHFHHQCSEQKMAQYRTHDLTKEWAYASTQIQAKFT